MTYLTSEALIATCAAERGAPSPYTSYPATLVPDEPEEMPARRAEPRLDVVGGFAVVVLAREATHAVEQILSCLDRTWFDVLHVKQLSRAESLMVAEKIADAGRPLAPAMVVAALDVNPKSPTRTQLRKRPELDNAHLLDLLLDLERVTGEDPTPLSLDHLWCSFNARQAAELAQAAMPEELARLCAEIEQRTRDNETPFPVIQNLTGAGGHAKVELVRHRGGLAVCKTFRTGKERFLKRELLARTGLAETIAEVPGVLAHGPNWVLTPYYRDVLRFDLNGFRLLPLDVARQAVEVLEKMYHAGYAYMDLKAENLLVDGSEGLKLVDFEYLHRYRRRPPSFADSYDVAGAPENFEGDKPLSGARTYATTLQYYVGLDLESLRGDPPWKQHLKRALYRWGTFVPRQLPRRLKSYLLRLINGPDDGGEAGAASGVGHGRST